MKTGELIAILAAYPPDAEVRIFVNAEEHEPEILDRDYFRRNTDDDDDEDIGDYDVNDAAETSMGNDDPIVHIDAIPMKDKTAEYVYDRLQRRIAKAAINTLDAAAAHATRLLLEDFPVRKAIKEKIEIEFTEQFYDEVAGSDERLVEDHDAGSAFIDMVMTRAEAAAKKARGF